MITLRIASPEDQEFLYQVYASTRTNELALVDWDEERKEQFLRMQFNAQDTYYRDHYPGAEFWVIEMDTKPVGRLYLHRKPDDLRIMDIALLPEFRRKGIGAGLLRRVLMEGDQTGVPVSIHVERFNPALNLYRRLGFRLSADKGVYLFLKRMPGTPVYG
jgi:GNAT superfamily N-acetyltransferase